MRKLLLLIFFFLGIFPFLNQGKLKIGYSAIAQSFGDEYGGWEDGGWQDGGEDGGWGGDWGMNDGDSWDHYGVDFYGTVTDIWEEILKNGLANFDDGYTKFTFDENGVTNNMDYYTWDQLQNDPTLVPNYIWDLTGALNEYYRHEQIYLSEFDLGIRGTGDLHTLKQYLTQHYNPLRFAFYVQGNYVHAIDAINQKEYLLLPGKSLPPDMPWPDMPYGDGPLGDAFYGVNPEDWGDIDFNWPDFENAPEIPYDPESIDWLYWMYGNGGTYSTTPQTPPAPEEFSGNWDPYLRDAKFGEILNYVTPSGVPIILPDDAKIFSRTGLDMDIYQTCGLLGFQLSDGTQYVAQFEKVYGIGTSDPLFLGYFELSPTGTVNKLNRFNSFQYPQPDNNKKIKVVRMKYEVVNGNCFMTREIVEYEMLPGVPNIVPSSSQKIYFGIKYETPVPGSPVDQGSVACPSTNQPPEVGNDWTLEQYITHRGPFLVNFFRNSIKSSVKVILYDCATGQAKYTITKSGANKVPSGNQTSVLNEYNNGTFSEDIAIKACIDYGEWNYDIKFSNNLTSHPKVTPHLQEVLDEIKANAQDEINNIKKVGQFSLPEEYFVYQGKFKKKAMELFPAALAIYDVGKHIIEEAAMPPTIWDAGDRTWPNYPPAGTKEKYENSPFNMPPLLAGATDQLVDELTGIVQLTKAGYQFIRHPKESLDGIYNSIRDVSVGQMKKFLVDMSGGDKYEAGGDVAYHQAGKHSIQAAMVFFSPVKNLTKGVDVIKKSGNEIRDLQKFIHTPSTIPNLDEVNNILKNSVENNHLVKNIDNEKIFTKNSFYTGEVRFNAIDKSGEIFDAKALNNMEEISEDVLKKADASDLAEAAEDAAVHTEMKTQPQRFKDGKDFEKNITNDPSHTSKIEAATGLDLSGFSNATQIQVKMADGSYIVADNLYYKKIPGTNAFEIVINESKLSSSSPFTENQLKFLNELQAGTTTFELRTSKLSKNAVAVPKGSQLIVNAFVKTVSDGTSGIGNYTVTQIP